MRHINIFWGPQWVFWVGARKFMLKSLCAFYCALFELLRVEGLVVLDGPNKLDARGVPGLGLVISLVSLCTCLAVASASKVVLPAIACHKSRQGSGTRLG